MKIAKKTNLQLVCFSHLSWKFVYQRPQHLLSRFTRKYDVYYIEEFVHTNEADGFSINITNEKVNVIIPNLSHNYTGHLSEKRRKEIVIDRIFEQNSIQSYIFWYYTPMALEFTSNFNPIVTVYDCMDELSAFKFAPPQLRMFEDELFNKADVVFTGGNNLYEAKKSHHHNIFPFPSSIDKAHFKSARAHIVDVEDQMNIPHPRLGFYGVIDERFDIDLIREAAKAQPDWHFVLIGPIVKIDPASLPQSPNIHYLGSKSYHELPLYLSGWDIALIPFAINESTQFISPTKTPEYLAGGKPVISTPIIDVANPYEQLGLVHIVKNVDEFIQAALLEFTNQYKEEWLTKVDSFLSDLSWDATWGKMNTLISESVEKNTKILKIKTNEYVRLPNSGSRIGRISSSRAVGFSS